jgi:hypothetical protein
MTQKCGSLRGLPKRSKTGSLLEAVSQAQHLPMETCRKRNTSPQGVASATPRWGLTVGHSAIDVAHLVVVVVVQLRLDVLAKGQKS